MSRLSTALLTVCFALGAEAAVAQGGGRPSDPQIAHIAYAAGQIDIKAAELARKQSKSKEVRAFAGDMLRDHKAVNAQALALLKKLNVKPEDNDTSRTLSQQAAAKEKELRALKGPAFDRAYAQNEVAFHQQVNGALQTTLIPSAQNPELKDLLSTGLRIFRATSTTPSSSRRGSASAMAHTGVRMAGLLLLGASLATVLGGQAAPGGSVHRVAMKAVDYEPKRVTVRAGDTVEWTN